MAQVTMDSSEYEAMKRIEDDLRKALDKQNELYEEVKKLQQEKIDIAEANTLKVCVITTHTNLDVVNTPGLAGRIERYLQNSSYSPYDRDFSRKLEYFISEQRTINEETDKNLTYVGFEEIKEQLRNEEAKKVGLNFEEVKQLRKLKLDYDKFNNLTDMHSNLERHVLELLKKSDAAKELYTKKETYLMTAITNAEKLIEICKKDSRSFFSWLSKKAIDSLNSYDFFIKKLEAKKKKQGDYDDIPF